MNDVDMLTRFAGLMTYKAADKEDLRPLLAKYGVDAPSKNNCPSCWRDAAIMALRAAKASDTPTDGVPRLHGRAGTVGVWWHGRLVNNDTMTPEMAEWLRTTNFPKQLYEK